MQKNFYCSFSRMICVILQAFDDAGIRVHLRYDRISFESLLAFYQQQP